MRRAAFAFVGVATLAVLIFIVFQSWSVMTRLNEMPLGDVSVAAPEQSSVPDPLPEVIAGGAESPSPVVTAPVPPAPDPPEEDKPLIAPPDATWVPPVEYAGMQPPGWRRDPHGAFWYYEAATMLEAAPGSPIVAAAPGVVAATMPAARGGWDVDVLHDNGYVTRYGNVFRLAVGPGEAVSAYSPLGVVGSSTGNDVAESGVQSVLPFTAWRAGEAVDAVALFGSVP